MNGTGIETGRTLRLTEAAAALGMSERTVQRLIARGELAVERLPGRRVRVPASEVERLRSLGYARD